MFNEDSDDDEFWVLNKFVDFSAADTQVQLYGGLLVLKPGAAYTQVYTIISYI